MYKRQAYKTENGESKGLLQGKTMQQFITIGSSVAKYQEYGVDKSLNHCLINGLFNYCGIETVSYTHLKHVTKNGVYFGEPTINLDEVRAGKEAVVAKLTGGLAGMAKARKVTVVEGLAAFTDPNTLVARDRDGNPTTVKFDNAIIAAGSRPIQLPFIPHEDPRIWDSTDALKLKEVPKKLLIMGGGIIGLEMGTVYHSLGSEIEVVEMFDQVIPAADRDVVAIYTKQIEKKFKLMLETKVTAVEAKDDGIYVSMEGKACNDTKRYDAVLVAIGRTPNGKLIDAGKAGVEVDERGFIHVDKQMRTNVPHIFAIGDIVGQPMLSLIHISKFYFHSVKIRKDYVRYLSKRY